MKKLLLWLIIFSVAVTAHSQPLPDSVIAKYKAAKTDKEKGTCLMNYFKKQILTDAKTKADILLLKTWFAKQNDEASKNYTNLELALILETNSDYPAALDLLFSELPQFESRKDTLGIERTYSIIGTT
jgi:hypothetical protein